MKLYTEEQVKQAMIAMHEVKFMDYTEEEIIDTLIPIELPTDEGIVNKLNSFINTEVDLKFLTKEQGERLKWYYKTYLIKEIYDIEKKLPISYILDLIAQKAKEIKQNEIKFSTDEKIEKHSDDSKLEQYFIHEAIDGVKWVIDKIKGGNK